MFWRFRAMSDIESSHVIIRDTDQRINDKDAQCVKEWIESGKVGHRMHEEHGQTGLTLMGCAFGIKSGVINNIDDLIRDWVDQHRGFEIDHWKNKKGTTAFKYGSDQVFLEEVVWPFMRDSCLTHGLLGQEFPKHDGFKWGGNYMFRRISPNTNNKEIFGKRPKFAYESEDSTLDKRISLYE